MERSAPPQNDLYMMMAVGFLLFKPRPTHAVFTKQTLIVFFVCAALISCRKLHSPGVTITTINNSGQTVNTIEIDYPGGSYGIGSLPPGGSRVRWIKPSGSAQLRIDFVDSTGEHQAKPLTLQSGDSGVVVLHILAGGGVSFEDNRQKK